MKFAFCRYHVESGTLQYDKVECENRLQFLEKLSEWNRFSIIGDPLNHWIYAEDVFTPTSEEE